MITAQYIAFAIFSALTLVGAVLVVYSRNLVHSSLWLIVSLFGVAGLFVLLSAPFLAAMQILIYIGAIGILFVFAVMLTRGMTRMTMIFNRQSWVGAVTAGLLFVGLLAGVILPVWGNAGVLPSQPAVDFVSTTRDFGMALVSGNGYVLPFEVASLLLTAAMVGAIVIARDDQ